MAPPPSSDGNFTFLAGGGEMGERIRAFDWARTPLGPAARERAAVVRRIREQSWGKETVLVALTGWGQEEDRRKSKDAGFDLHMVKPVDLDILMERLATLPAGSRR
jgi:CheY-like chemotaxis protein